MSAVLLAKQYANIALRLMENPWTSIPPRTSHERVLAHPSPRVVIHGVKLRRVLQFSAAGAHAKICTLNDDERPDVPRELELVGTRGHLGKCDLHGATYYTAHGPLLRNDMILTIYLRIGRLVRIRMPHSRAFSHPGAACSHPGAACAPSQIATSWGTDQ